MSTSHAASDAVESSRIAAVCGVVERACLGIAKPVRWAARGWFPYGYHIVESLARAVAYVILCGPLLLGTLLLASYAVGGPHVAVSSLSASVEQAEAWMVQIRSDMFLLSGVIVATYAYLGVLPYAPKDWHMRAWRTRNVPEAPFEWELVTFALPASVAPLGLFAVWWMRPSVATVVPGGWYGVAGLCLVGGLATYWVARRRADTIWSDSTKARLTRDTLVTNGWLMLLFGFGVTVMSVVVGVERAATPVMLLTMGWLARRMRWMLYEDRDGFLDFEPSILFWGIVTRLPYAYALTVAGLVGSDAVATSLSSSAVRSPRSSRSRGIWRAGTTVSTDGGTCGSRVQNTTPTNGMCSSTSAVRPRT